jgi:hypothetical protein
MKDPVPIFLNDEQKSNITLTISLKIHAQSLYFFLDNSFTLKKKCKKLVNSPSCITIVCGA